jgi:hypothetical protein
VIRVFDAERTEKTASFSAAQLGIALSAATVPRPKALTMCISVKRLDIVPH